MQLILKLFSSKEFLLFIFTGGIAAVVNFLSRIFYNQWLSFSYSIILAYITGMITAFVLAKIFVFKNTTQSVHKSAAFFILVNIVAIIQTWLISMSMAFYILPTVDIQRYAHEIAHAIGVMVPVFSSYLGHKYFTFK